MPELAWPTWVLFTVGVGTFSGAVIMVSKLGEIVSRWAVKGVRYAARQDVIMLTEELESVIDDIAYIRRELTVEGDRGSMKAVLYELSEKFDQHMDEYHAN
jgi:hypothetical protein